MLARRLFTLAIAVLAFALGSSATLAHHIKLTFAEVAQTADLIFVGTVAAQTSRANPQRSMVFTDVTFTDVEVVNATGRSKQKAASTITVTFPGGTADGLTVSLCDSARFRTGGRYVLCALDDGQVYSNPLVGGPQGLFEVERDRQSGEEFVLTAGRHAVVALKEAELVTTAFQVAAIDNGALVPDRSEGASKMEVEAPISADGALATASKQQTTDASVRPLTLRQFVDQVRNVALKVQLRERRIRTGEGGKLIQTVDGKTVASELKRPAPQSRAIASDPNALAAPTIAKAGSGPSPSVSPNASAGLSKVLGGPLGACGYQDVFINMEQFPANWSEWQIANDCMWTWNQSRDIFRYVDDDGGFQGGNGVSEFTGYPSSADLNVQYGWGWGASEVAVTAVYGGKDCARITEGDVSLNPAYSWSNDPIADTGRAGVYQIRSALMHELGHVWGEQDGGYFESYDYDLPTVMQSIYDDVAESGWGVHWPDAQLVRAIYDWQGVGADVGVESYYASNGLNNSTISGTTFYAGDPITLGQVTVENMSNWTIQGVNVRFYLSTDRYITADDYQMGSNWTWAGFSGETYSVFDYAMNVPSVPAGSYYVGAIVTINGFEPDAYNWNNATFFMDKITVRDRISPFIASVSATIRPDRPFKLKMTGSDIQPGMRVFLGSDAVEWTSTRFKNNGLFVLKGGEALKQWFPEGVEVPIRLVNPDGGETTVTFLR